MLNITDAKILIIDDDPINIAILEEVLECLHYSQFTSFTDPLKAIESYKDNEYDLVLLDIMMPVLDGFGVMLKIKELNKELTPPIIVLTASTDTETRRKALREGAQDFLLKPYDEDELTSRIYNILNMYLSHKYIINQNKTLEEAVSERTKELLDTQQDIIRRLGFAAEYRDTDTADHTIRVGEYSLVLGTQLGLHGEQLTNLHHAAPMHDLGKIGIRDSILLKPGKFTPEERKEMETHSEIGAKILASDTNSLLMTARDIAISHHERWDGKGYPYGLKGKDIPLCGRIVMVADVFDALTMKRTYKEAWSTDAAIDFINEHSGSMFDPNIVDAFNDSVTQIMAIKDCNY